MGSHLSKQTSNPSTIKTINRVQIRKINNYNSNNIIRTLVITRSRSNKQQ